MTAFGARLSQALSERGPLCVGIDPHAALLADWGLPDTVDGLRRFCAMAVDAIADLVPAVKPQSAFFERFGSAGIAVLESTIRQSRERGALVILDVKRGDIGSTAAAYAQAYLGVGSPLRADAVTVNPYLGFGALVPFLEEAQAHGGGVFVLSLTSNPEGREIQHARLTDGRTVAQGILDEVAERNRGVHPLGSVGVVIGATTGPTEHDLTRLNAPVLVPGLGAQGATTADIATIFAGLDGVVLPSSSRDILRHGPDLDAIRAAVASTLVMSRKIATYPIL